MARDPWKLSAAKRDAGSKRIVLPRCARRWAKTTPSGAVAILSTDRRTRRPGSMRWRRKAGPHPLGQKNIGGGGLSAAENNVLQEELRRLKARAPLFSFGLWMLGPVLLEYANEAQKEEHLPKIVRGEIRWCQGYSEPGAGSDLASLQTSCEDKGDHFLVNGQKLWTSYANEADWMFCLVRTDSSVKHEGISFVLVRHADAGRRDAPDQANLRQFALLRNVPDGREGSQAEFGRETERRLGDRQEAFDVRAPEHLGRGLRRRDRLDVQSKRSPNTMWAWRKAS